MSLAKLNLGRLRMNDRLRWQMSLVLDHLLALLALLNLHLGHMRSDLKRIKVIVGIIQMITIRKS